MTTEYLGISGDGATAKLFLGDSAGSGDASLGLYGSLTERKELKESLAKVTAMSGTSQEPVPVGGGGMYNPLNNRPMNR